MRLPFRPALLAALWAATPCLLQAQGTDHPQVPARRMIIIQHNEYFDPAAGTTITRWFEYHNGHKTEMDPTGYVVPAGRTLVITDLELILHCDTATDNPPVMAITISTPTGEPLQAIVRFIPTRTVPGLELQRVSLTSGVAIPEGYRISVPDAPWGAYTLRRAALMGYLTN